MYTPVSDAQCCANQLLAALHSEERARWLPQMECVELLLGQVLFEANETITHVVFPTTAIVSLLPVVLNGAAAENAIVGPEGIVGAALFMGDGAANCRAVVQSAGLGLQLRAELLKDELDQNPDVLRLLLRYTQALTVQVAQAGVCHRQHSLEQQLCRWLLLRLDRLNGEELPMAPELVANELGVRRAEVTQAAGALQADGVIRCSGGRLTLLNRGALEARACECFDVVTNAYQRLLHPSTDAYDSVSAS